MKIGSLLFCIIQLKANPDGYESGAQAACFFY